jgi:hypothetical protein
VDLVTLTRDERYLHHLGRQVVYAERVHGLNSPQHRAAVTRWQDQQKRLGITG